MMFSFSLQEDYLRGLSQGASIREGQRKLEDLKAERDRVERDMAEMASRKDELEMSIKALEKKLAQEEVQVDVDVGESSSDEAADDGICLNLGANDDISLADVDVSVFDASFLYPCF